MLHGGAAVGLCDREKDGDPLPANLEDDARNQGYLDRDKFNVIFTEPYANCDPFTNRQRIWAGIQLIAQGVCRGFDFVTSQDREDAQSEATLLAMQVAGQRRGDAFSFFSTVIRNSICSSCRRTQRRRSHEQPLSCRSRLAGGATL